MLGQLDSMIFSVHKISSELRPRILDDLGFIEAVRWLADDFTRRTGIRCSYRFSNHMPDLDRKHATTLFRICQEALTNILRHSMASQVVIAVKKTVDGIEMTIRDNGIGISGEKAGAPLSLGIVGIRERAHLLGGEVNIRGRKNKGTTISVLLPLPSDRSEVK
jgi:signal transduction histidine kinase